MNLSTFISVCDVYFTYVCNDEIYSKIIKLTLSMADRLEKLKNLTKKK